MYVVRDMRIKNHLSGIWIGRFVKDIVEIAAVLSIVYKRILATIWHVPGSDRGSPHKIEFLRSTAAGHSWAKESLSCLETASLTFQQLYVEPKIAIQLEREK